MSSANEDTFVADEATAGRRRFWIGSDPLEGPTSGVRGWSFIVEEAGPDGQWLPIWDTWEEWFFEIIRYPAEYARGELTWRRESTGEVVDLCSLQPVYDGRQVAANESAEDAGLRHRLGVRAPWRKRLPSLKTMAVVVALALLALSLHWWAIQEVGARLGTPY